MKRTILLIIAMGLLLAVQAYAADSGRLKLSCEDRISKKIADCQRTAHLFSSCSNPSIEAIREMRRLQADFYQRHRAELVNAMLATEVGDQTHKIDYFLITQFKNGGHSH